MSWLPDDEQIRRYQSLLTASLKPVRPLASDATLVWKLLALFAAFSLIAALPFGFGGFRALNGYQRFAYYFVILLCAICFSITTVHEMIPGSKRQTSARRLFLITTLSLALLVSLLFHEFDLSRFIPLGVPCLRLGSVCALSSGILFWLFVRRGFLSSPVTAGATVGFFAGLAGVAVLALHCPIENSAHIIVWHLGAMVLGGLGGATAGLLRR